MFEKEIRTQNDLMRCIRKWLEDYGYGDIIDYVKKRGLVKFDTRELAFQLSRFLADRLGIWKLREERDKLQSEVTSLKFAKYDVEQELKELRKELTDLEKKVERKRLELEALERTLREAQETVEVLRKYEKVLKTMEKLSRDIYEVVSKSDLRLREFNSLIELLGDKLEVLNNVLDKIYVEEAERSFKNRPQVQKILELARNRGIVSTKTLCKELGLTPKQAGNLLAYLASKGLLKRIDRGVYEPIME